MGSSQSSHAKSKASPFKKNKEQPKELSVGGRESTQPILRSEPKNKEPEISQQQQQRNLISEEFVTDAVVQDDLSDVEHASTDSMTSFDDSSDDEEEENDDDAEYDEFLAERLCILQDAKHLKQLAQFFSHPEEPVVAKDPFASGRNFFSRPSAVEQESVEDAEERVRILADAQALKKYAVDYLHPELPVVTTDATATGRNYFDRASAVEQESVDDMEERKLILADMHALKKLAVDYLHPELPVVTTDSMAAGRNYFSRASAVEQESVEEAEEHARVLADAQALKKYAVDYLHPEVPVVTTDATAAGRNYFDRASGVEQESPEESEEHARVLAECQALKQLAVDFLHPEKPVMTTDPFACGRNYFRRASAKGNFDVITSTTAPVDFHALEDRFHLESHFEMDDVHLEEHLDEFVHHLHAETHAQGLHFMEHPTVDDDKEEEGKLSRSPSSVMLFGLEANQGY